MAVDRHVLPRPWAVPHCFEGEVYAREHDILVPKEPFRGDGLAGDICSPSWGSSVSLMM